MRFQIVTVREAISQLSAIEIEELELDDDEYDQPEILWDNDTNSPAWIRYNLEPEDATLNRAFAPLIQLLNNVSDGA